MEKNIEFEEMKQQLRVLQQRIDNQVEINEKQTRRAIEDSKGSLRKKDRREIIFNLLALILFPVILLLIKGLSTPFLAASFILMLGLNLIKILFRFDNRKISGMSLVETAQYLLKYKKNTRKNILYGLPFAILWFIWLALEIRHIPSFEGCNLTIIYVKLAICSIIGAAVGFRLFYFNQMRVANRLLRQIEEVQGEK